MPNVALSRGTDINTVYVFTQPSKRADPAPGPRSAPELARYDKKSAERTGDPAPATPLLRRVRRSACCPPYWTATARRPGPR